jgi:hypothetical protein
MIPRCRYSDVQDSGVGVIMSSDLGSVAHSHEETAARQAETEAEGGRVDYSQGERLP